MLFCWDISMNLFLIINDSRTLDLKLFPTKKIIIPLQVSIPSDQQPRRPSRVSDEQSCYYYFNSELFYSGKF